MTPLLPTPDHYIYNLITMTSSEAKRLWRRSIKGKAGTLCSVDYWDVLSRDRYCVVGLLVVSGGESTGRPACPCRGTEGWPNVAKKGSAVFSCNTAVLRG